MFKEADNGIDRQCGEAVEYSGKLSSTVKAGRNIAKLMTTSCSSMWQIMLSQKVANVELQKVGKLGMGNLGS